MQNKKKSLSSDTADKLKRMILIDKIYKPNEQLPNETELANRLDVSRTTIREAIKSLIASGVIKIVRGVGTFVSENPSIQPDPFGLSFEPDKIKVLLDWYYMRLILEPGAVELVVANATNDEISNLKQIALSQKSILDEDNLAFVRADQKLHTELALATHNIIMEKLIPSLYQSVYYDSVVYDIFETNKILSNKFKSNAMEYHIIMIHFIELRDANGASLAMRYHIQSLINEINFNI